MAISLEARLLREIKILPVRWPTCLIRCVSRYCHAGRVCCARPRPIRRRRSSSLPRPSPVLRTFVEVVGEARHVENVRPRSRRHPPCAFESRQFCATRTSRDRNARRRSTCGIGISHLPQRRRSMTNKKTASLFALSLLTACGTDPAGTTTTSTTSALVGDQNNQGNDDHQGDDDHGDHADIKHVLLISVDGMHQSDLHWYVANHPSSTLAKLTHAGSEYTNASTSNPSDSDPGGTALMTGGNPKSTGVFYDVEYSHKVDEAGAACTPGQPATGGDVIYDSPDDALANVPDFVDPANGR